jgi:hypothetical protein
MYKRLVLIMEFYMGGIISRQKPVEIRSATEKNTSSSSAINYQSIDWASFQNSIDTIKSSLNRSKTVSMRDVLKEKRNNKSLRKDSILRPEQLNAYYEKFNEITLKNSGIANITTKEKLYHLDELRKTLLTKLNKILFIDQVEDSNYYIFNESFTACEALYLWEDEHKYRTLAENIRLDNIYPSMKQDFLKDYRVMLHQLNVLLMQVEEEQNKLKSMI